MEKNKTQKKDEIAELLKLCNEYCKLLEKSDKIVLNEFLESLASKMMAIYKQCFEINRFQTRYESDAEKFLSEKQYNKMLKTLRDILDKRDNYNEIIDPNKPASNAVFQASLSEDLTDIYQDFYDFVAWYSLGTLESINDSVIECLNNFEKYWGIKLLNALRAIHLLRYFKKDGSLFRDPKEEEEAGPVVSVEEDETVDSDGLDEFLKDEL